MVEQILFLELLPCQLIDLTIARWFPIKLDTLIQNEVAGCTIVMYFHTAIVNNRKQQLWFFLVVACVAIYLFNIFYQALNLIASRKSKK